MAASGALDHRLTFLRASIVDDGTARVPGEPVPVGKRWASRRDVTDAERLRGGELGTAVDLRFVVRSDSLTRALQGIDSIEVLPPQGAKFTCWITGTRVVGNRSEDIEINASTRPDQPAAGS